MVSLICILFVVLWFIYAIAWAVDYLKSFKHALVSLLTLPILIFCLDVTAAKLRPLAEQVSQSVVDLSNYCKEN